MYTASFVLHVIPVVPVIVFRVFGSDKRPVLMSGEQRGTTILRY